MTNTHAGYERSRLIHLGIITPAHLVPPTLLVKNEKGDWIPEVKRYEGYPLPYTGSDWYQRR